MRQVIEDYLETKLQSSTHTVEELPFDINFLITSDGITPLMLACTIGDIDIVKLILANPQLNINKVDNSGINAIYVCAYYGHFDILKLLR